MHSRVTSLDWLFWWLCCISRSLVLNCFFHVNAYMYMLTNYTCILLRLSVVCTRYVYCTFYATVLSDLAVTMYMNFNRRNNPQKCPFPGGSTPPPNTWFLGPIRVHDKNGISISSAILQGSMAHYCDQDTHRDRPQNIDSNKLHLCTLCMRCSLKTKHPNIQR